MKTHRSPYLAGSTASIAWPLLLLALGACQAPPPGVPEPGDASSTTAEDGSGTSTGSEPDGTSSSTGSENEPEGTTGSTSSESDTSQTSEGDASSGTAGDSSESGEPSEPPGVPVLTLTPAPIKQFNFSWEWVEGADYYQLLESLAPGEPFVQIGEDIVGEWIPATVPLFARHQASYVLRACNPAGCTDSAPVDVVGSLAEAVGYLKASNTGADDSFGWSVTLSGDGNTLVVGAYGEDSSATGIDGDQANDSAPDSGAVYVFVRDAAGQWSQEAYIKASNTDAGDSFGAGFFRVKPLALSSDGDTLAIGAPLESSNAIGIDGDEANDSANDAGAVYVFARDAAGQWSQQAYVKASNTDAGDWFGMVVTLSGDGNTLAVGAPSEDSGATGVDGDQGDTASGAGAVYVFVRDAAAQWSQQAYVKASNTDANDEFGFDVALSGDGSTLVVGAPGEDGNATGIDGDQANDVMYSSGAAYVFVRDAMDQWSQQAYVKASNPGTGDAFGYSVALGHDGDTLAVGAYGEESSATGIDGDQTDDSLFIPGAVYVLVRDPLDQWSQQAYVKASNTGVQDHFGQSLALNSDGNVLAIGAPGEDSNATGINGDQVDDSIIAAGAVYVLVRDPLGEWSQQAYVKAPDTSAVEFGDDFGFNVALSNDGSTLAVGAYREDSDATGIGGDQGNELMADAGAVYLY